MNNKSESQILESYYEKYLAKEGFKLGMLVEWKHGLKNKRYPRYKQPVIVVEILQEPIISGLDEASSQYYREPLDVKLGMLDEDAEFATFYYDSGRFTRFKE